MSRAARASLAIGVTLVILALALIYPVMARGEAWAGVRFESPWMLLGLLVVPFVWWWGIWGQDARRPRLRIGTIAPLLVGPRGARSYLRDLPAMLRSAALVLLVVAMARPVSVLRDQKAEEKGIDIMIVMDLSGSMRAVLNADSKDLPGAPQVNKKAKRLTRLDTAKIVVQDFIRRRRTDRIGSVVFGKSAFLLSPPTLDYHLLIELVSKLNLDVIDGGATAIGDAVGTAVARLRRSDAKSKVIILLTDGESNSGSIAAPYSAQLAKNTGVKIYPIQIGTDDLVDVEEGRDLFGQPIYVQHRYPVNPVLLKEMARETGGQSFIATDGKALAASMHAVLDHLERTRFEATSASFEDLFPFLLFPGVVLVGLDALLRAWLLRRFP